MVEVLLDNKDRKKCVVCVVLSPVERPGFCGRLQSFGGELERQTVRDGGSSCQALDGGKGEETHTFNNHCMHDKDHHYDRRPTRYSLFTKRLVTILLFWSNINKIELNSYTINHEILIFVHICI